MPDYREAVKALEESVIKTMARMKKSWYDDVTGQPHGLRGMSDVVARQIAYDVLGVLTDNANNRHFDVP